MLIRTVACATSCRKVVRGDQGGLKILWLRIGKGSDPLCIDQGSQLRNRTRTIDHHLYYIDDARMPLKPLCAGHTARVILEKFLEELHA